MLSKWFSSNKATIRSRSNGNLILQDNKIDNLFVYSQPSELIGALSAAKDYNTIQKTAQDMMAVIKRSHPLPDLFSVQFDNDLERLISTPETAEALEKYPKRIECKVRLDFKKYPHMNQDETPWDYAYRTQTAVEMETTAYQEYLGDIVDPFPIREYSDGMMTTIVPPSFPPAIPAAIVADDVSIPILLERKPCLEYGKMVFETPSNEFGFDFRLTVFESPKKINFSFTTIPGYPLAVQLQREQLLCAIKRSCRLSITHEDKVVASANFKEKDLSAEIFTNAPYYVRYLSNLQTIEKHIGCTFDMNDMSPISPTVYRTAFILASSLKHQWHCIEMDFDDDVHCDYNNFSSNFEQEASSNTDKVVEGEVLHVHLQGLWFRADKYTLVYRNARVNNIKSIVKNCKKRKKGIMVTFRPLSDHTCFQKYCKFEGIELLTSP